MQASRCQSVIDPVIRPALIRQQTMPATRDSGVQPVAVGFQCCSCCGQPGRKITTCSCRRQTGNRHQCLNLIKQKQGEQKKERSQTRKWLYFSLALLQQPEQEKETEWEVVNIQAEIKVQRPRKNIWI